MVDREQAEHALGLWRTGERLLRRRTHWAEDYEQALARALAYLERYTTRADLVAAYFDDAIGGEKLRWLVAARRQSGRRR